MNLDALVDLLKSGATMNLAKDNHVVPLFALMLPGSKVDFVLAPYRSDEEKEAVAMKIRERVRSTRAEAVGHVSECWTVMGPWDTKDPRPQDHPNRMEAIIVRAEDRTGTTRAAIALIVRERPGDESSKATLKEWREMPQAQVEEGRFVGMFTPPLGAKAN